MTQSKKPPTNKRKWLIFMKRERDLNPGPQGYEDFLRK